MAIYIPNASDNKIPTPLADAIEAQECFYCGGNLFNDENHSTGGVVIWQGSDNLIALHQPCAETLSIHLIQDARTLVSKTKNIAKLSHELPTKVNYLWHAQ